MGPIFSKQDIPPSDSDPGRVSVLHTHKSKLVAPKYVVVFIHGIGGDARDTWLNSETEHLWYATVADMRPHWDVFVVRYDSSFFREKNPASHFSAGMNLTSLARNVFLRLNSGLPKNASIVFVCHSMGGLIVKEIFRFAKEAGSNFRFITERCAGILFLGTPHYGAHIGEYAEYLADYLGSALLKDISDNNFQYLRELDEFFRDVVAGSSIVITNLIELYPTKGITVVTHKAATLLWTKRHKNFEFDGDHIQIAKPRNPMDMQFQELEVILGQVDVTPVANKTLFCHFYDHYLLQSHEWDLSQRKKELVLNEIDYLTRIGIFLFDVLIIPGSAIYEIPECETKILEFDFVFPGRIKGFGEGQSFREYAETATLRFDESDPRSAKYSFKARHGSLGFVGRNRSATREVTAKWRRSGPESILSQRGVKISTAEKRLIEKRWLEVPEQIPGKAFIADYIVPALLDGETNKSLARHVQATTGDFFYDSTCSEFSAYVIVDLDWLNRPLSFFPRGGQISLRTLNAGFARYRCLPDLTALPLQKFAEFCASPSGQSIRQELRTRLLGDGPGQAPLVGP